MESNREKFLTDLMVKSKVRSYGYVADIRTDVKGNTIVTVFKKNFLGIETSKYILKVGLQSLTARCYGYPRTAKILSEVIAGIYEVNLDFIPESDHPERDPWKCFF